jgi:mono/diheme cytochrome c family protein
MRRILGCLLSTLTASSTWLALPASSAAAESVTFNKHIAPLVFQNCAGCHRPGEVAPFSLLSYADVSKRAKQIQEVTRSRYMPPWKSVPGHGQFVGERRLSDEQVALLASWVEQGMPEGEAKDLPQPPQFRDGWKLGPPDIVLTMPEAYAIPADGPDIYRNFVFDVNIPTGKYLKAAEYRPGNRKIVHHAALAIDMDGRARREDEADPLPGSKGSLSIPGRLLPGSLSAWTPGRDPAPLPEGISLPWQPGAALMLQLHLHPSGKPESEQSSVGLYVTDQPPRRAMADVTLIARKIDIPPGEKEYRSRDEFTLPIATQALGIFPHMHLIGKDIKITAQPPEGESFSLLWINDWDFNWQGFYECAAPVKLPAGTKIVLETIHDNSAENFRNPFNPPRRITYGEQTSNEMSAAVLQLTPASDDELPKLRETLGRRIIGTIAPAGQTQQPPAELAAFVKDLLAKHDADKSGTLSFAELATASGKPDDEIKRLAGSFDANSDGALDEAELAKAVAKLRGQ